ncbi:MAG: hypothetical protein RRY78_02335 [Clostridia bacterium]
MKNRKNKVSTLQSDVKNLIIRLNCCQNKKAIVFAGIKKGDGVSTIIFESAKILAISKKTLLLDLSGENNIENLLCKQCSNCANATEQNVVNATGQEVEPQDANIANPNAENQNGGAVDKTEKAQSNKNAGKQSADISVQEADKLPESATNLMFEKVVATEYGFDYITFNNVERNIVIFKPEFVEQVKAMYDKYDIILVKTANLQSSAEGFYLAKQFDGCVLILSVGARIKDVTKVLKIMEENETDVIGAVLNKA